MAQNSTFWALITYPRFQQLVFCYYNIKLKIRDMEAEIGEEEENQLFQWGRLLHLDDKYGNHDPRIAAHVQEASVNVDRVLSEEVHSESLSQDMGESFQPIVTSQPSSDSSVEHSSRPSFADTSTIGYDGLKGERTNDGSDTEYDGGDIANPQPSQYSLSLFTNEDDFTHATQDEDHDSRRVGPGIGAIGKSYRGRQRRMTPYNEDSFSASFESMGIRTQFNDSSNENNIFPPYTMSYGQSSSNPSGSIGEEYGMINYPYDPQMSFQISYQMS